MTKTLTKPKAAKAKLEIRNALIKDIKEIISLCDKVYSSDKKSTSGDMSSYTPSMIKGQINHFREGQYVAVYEGKIVGYSASFRISGEVALKKHTWNEITGGGFASRHETNGEYLYGMEVCVDKDYRNLRIGQRLYNSRKELAVHLELKGIIFAGRMPGFKRKVKEYPTPEEYLAAVKEKKVKDRIINFQIRNGFEVIKVIKNYLKGDTESLNNAALMMWKNPKLIEYSHYASSVSDHALLKESVRVATVQYQQRKVSSFDEFCKHIEYFVDVVADYKGDFVVFPELFTCQLLSIENEPLSPIESIEKLTEYTEPLKQKLSELAVSYNINIIGGSHPTKTKDDQILNVCYVMLRDGSIHEQVKIHPTPNEKYWWNIQGGDEVHTIMTDCGPIGVLICYDSEFPELARYLVDQGALMLFVPFCTDQKQAYMRVRYCSQARAIENQCYVVMSGNVGNLPGVENMDIQYAQSCILTPCDFPFSRDGVAADTTPNAETVAFADLRLDTLVTARNSGTVKNLKDRRFDLYSTVWKND
jgi:predicted amidohydrolase/ribosomal protein S18 acetylase RimI-like enzyme